MNSGSRALDSDWHRLPADDQASGAARRHVVTWLRARKADARVVDDFALAASELAANVVQHGDADYLYIRLDDGDPNRWTLEIAGGRNHLPEHLADPASWSVARPESSHGRGLGIVRTVVDEIEVLEQSLGLGIRCHHLRV